ncbi:MAG: SCP2 sterol-binding domain-containing protein [Thermoleophilaceae bacterium]
MPQFLSEDWVQAIEDAMNANYTIKEFAGWAYITLEHVATGVPDRGEVRHWRRFADGRVQVQLGAADSPDATMTTSYEDAVAINKGELDLQAAFTGGKLKVDGDVTKLLQYQAELSEVAAAVHGVDAAY